MGRVSLEDLRQETGATWLLILLQFAFPMFVVAMLFFAKDERGFCARVMLMNRYESLGDCVRANPGIPLSVCQYNPGPLAGDFTGPIYKNPNCGKTKPQVEKWNRFNVPDTLPYLATSIEPLKRCPGWRSWYWCSAYTASDGDVR